MCGTRPARCHACAHVHACVHVRARAAVQGDHIVSHNYIAMAYVVMAYVVMAYIAMAYTVMDPRAAAQGDHIVSVVPWRVVDASHIDEWGVDELASWLNERELPQLSMYPPATGIGVGIAEGFPSARAQTRRYS